VLTQHALKEGNQFWTVFHDENRGEVGSRVHRRQKILLIVDAASLESAWIGRLLLCVSEPFIEPLPPRHQAASPFLVVGTIVASATLGALLAIGRRLGSVALPLGSIGAAFLNRTVSGVDGSLVVTGLLLHLVAVFAWTLLFLWLVRTHRWRSSVAAIAVGVAAHVVSWLTAWMTGGGLAAVLPLGDRLVYAVVLAGALVVGTRFAFSPSQGA
jgi:hypothetical protein